MILTSKQSQSTQHQHYEEEVKLEDIMENCTYACVKWSVYKGL